MTPEFLKGWKAGFDCKPFWSNPHAEEDPATFTEWARGWCAGRRDATEEPDE